MPETVIAMLATASLGAVWSSCSPDFGVQGVLDRFGQIEPKVLFCADGYFYNGKAIDSRPRIAEFTAGLPSLKKEIGRASCRERVCSVRVDLGGRRIIKKKSHYSTHTTDNMNTTTYQHKQ